MSKLNIIQFSIKMASSFPSLGRSVINNYYEDNLDQLRMDALCRFSWFCSTFQQLWWPLGLVLAKILAIHGQCRVLKLTDCVEFNLLILLPDSPIIEYYRVEMFKFSYFKNQKWWNQNDEICIWCNSNNER